MSRREQQRTMEVQLVQILFIFFITCNASLSLEIGRKVIEEDEAYCNQIQLSLCLCSTSQGSLRVNCDGVLFPGEFPLRIIQSKEPITYFSLKGVGAQNLPPQAFIPFGGGLEHLDLSENNLRRISERGFKGIETSLLSLDLGDNALGDQLNPIFSTSEIKKLPRLKKLRLSNNSIRKIEGGLLHGTISLQELDLDANEFREVPSLSSPNGPQHIRSLNLAFNHIQEVKRGDFDGLGSLRALNLTGNRLNKIGTGAFFTLQNLGQLTFRLNHLLRINSDAFNGLESLEDLDLSENFLREFPSPPLRTLRSLKTLRISSNLIHTLSPESFEGIHGLRELSLSRNRLTQLPEDAFQKLKELHELDLSVNQLRTIPKNLFRGLTALKSLNLNDNLLLLFPSDALQTISSLQTLQLGFNRISAIQEIPAKNLTMLNLENNLIRFLPPSSLQPLTQLQQLQLQGNQMESLDELQFPPSLTQLDLSRNNISVLPRLNLASLRLLRADENQIHHLLPHNFLLLPRLDVLSLRGNKIENISLNAFASQLQFLSTLDLSQNQLESTENIQDFPSLTHLNISFNQLSLGETLLNLPLLQNLDLRHNQITHVSQPLTSAEDEQELRTLLFDDNEIHSFRGLFANYSKLRVLSISGNRIRYLFPQALQNLSSLSVLNLSNNELSFFPVEILNSSRDLSSIDLSFNFIKHLQEVSFANFPKLKNLKLSGNEIETLPLTPFRNSSQLSFIDLSQNKLEEVGESLFEGILQLELNLQNNYITSLPAQMFHRTRVQRLRKLDISNNHFNAVPSALQQQIFNINHLNMSVNQVKEIPAHSNTLTNIHTLDVSHNPLSPSAVHTILNEPKTTRVLVLRNTSTHRIPPIEIPFLRVLDLSFNRIDAVLAEAFNRTTLLDSLLLSNNPLHAVPSPLPNSLSTLDLSNTDLHSVTGNPFPPSLNHLLLNGLHQLSRIEKGTLFLPLLKQLEIGDTPKLGYIDTRGILNGLHYLEKLEIELKDREVLDQLHSILSPRLEFVGIQGKGVESISTGALAGWSSMSINIQIRNTSISTLPPILVPLPTSSFISLHLEGNEIETISPPLLSQRIRISGINPICNCNTLPLLTYFKNIRSAAVCSSPPLLKNRKVVEIEPEDLHCSSSSSSIAVPVEEAPPPSFPTPPTTTSTTEDDDIIWSLPPKKTSPRTTTSTPPAITSSSEKNKKNLMDTNAMDNLILGIVGGTIGILLIFILSLLCCLRKRKREPASSRPMEPNCTCPPSKHLGGTLRLQHPMHHPLFQQQMGMGGMPQILASPHPYVLEYDHYRR